MASLQDLDFTATIRDYDFTRRAIRRMSHIVYSDMFADMDCEMIFQYLKQEMEIVSFKDYLRRYLYEKAELTEPFHEIPDELYIDIIMTAFEDHNAPYSFEPTSVKKRAQVKLWLSRSGITRNGMFVLGFGLGMEAGEVTQFLTKVLQEDDFDFMDPEEVVYWYCMHHHCSYPKAKKYLSYYAQLPQSGKANEKLWQAMCGSPTVYLSSESGLLEYLRLLKQDEKASVRQEVLKEAFQELYSRTRNLVAEKYWAEDEPGLKAEDVTPADLEKILCCGVPLNAKGNLEKMSASLLAKQFAQKRMSRQRITAIQAGKQQIERFDLITLLFFIYAVDVEPDWPTERYLKYIDEINEILRRVGMSDIYPVNPYESFILMCLLTDDPLPVYGEIWERSYEG